MTKIIVHIEGHYEVHEAPFSRSYESHPASVTLVCDCGEELTLTGASATPTRSRCGAGYRITAPLSTISKKGHLRHTVTHPWRHEAKEQAEQNVRDEAAHPEGSPWRYDDITSRGTE
jgi:hypothetical protein